MTTLRSLPRVAMSALAAAALLTSTLAATAADTADAAGRNYYVGCDGSDSAPGKSATKAWRSLSKANDAELRPGDKLYLQRGCTWNGQRLDVTWSGTASAPIIIANYGSGSKPMIRNGKNSNVKITGSHVIVRGLRVDFDNLPTVACGQPIGNVYGFNLTGGANNVTITSSEASGATAGIHISKNSRNNLISKNKIFENDVMTTFGANPSKDLGAWGILVRSDGNRITKNRLSDNRARCQNQGYKLMSNSIELYEADDNMIDRNRSTGERVFSELGSSSSDVAEGNVFEFNLFDSDMADARFITTRGADVPFGPVRSTRVLHNTINLTGPGSKGIICGGSCGAGILELHNNVIVAQEKAIYASGNADIGRNIVWSSNGDPFIQIGANGDAEPSALVFADPRFTNPGRGNFRLRNSSPGTDRSTGIRESNTDITGRQITGNGDIGAFDR